MLEIARLPDQRICDDRLGQHVLELEIATEGTPHRFHGLGPRYLVERNADPVITDLAQIDAFAPCRFENFGLAALGEHRDGVEEDRRIDDEIELFQACRQRRRLDVDATGDGAKPDRAMEDGIHRGDDGEQHLRGADVRRRLFAANVLLAGLQRQPVGLVAARIDGDADQASGHRALVGVLDRHVGRVRTAVADRNAEALHRADGNVRAHLAGRLEQRQRQRIGGNNGNRLVRVQRRDHVGEIMHMAVCARILEDGAEDRFRVELGERVTDDHLPAQRFGAGADHVDGLRMAMVIDEKRGPLGLRRPLRHRHGFRRRRRLVKQRGVGDVEPGEIGDHGLEIQERFQPALADFRLVGRIGRVPCRVFENRALDHRRHDGAVVALTDQRQHHLVLLRRGPQVIEHLALAHRIAEGERRFLPDRARHRLVDQRVQRRGADNLEHVGDLRRRRADMAAVGEVVRIVVGQLDGHGLSQPIIAL